MQHAFMNACIISVVGSIFYHSIIPWIFYLRRVMTGALSWLCQRAISSPTWYAHIHTRFIPDAFLQVPLDMDMHVFINGKTTDACHYGLALLNLAVLSHMICKYPCTHNPIHFSRLAIYVCVHLCILFIITHVSISQYIFTVETKRKIDGE